MTRVAYYEEQIRLAIPKLGRAGEDTERLRQIAPLFRDNVQATMAACMAALYPDKQGKAAVDAFKAFRGRVGDVAPRWLAIGSCCCKLASPGLLI